MTPLTDTSAVRGETAASSAPSATAATAAARADYPILPTPFTAVKLNDRFWFPRMETNRKVTIPVVLARCEQYGRVDNFRKAAGLMEGPYVGTHPGDDTDLYKAIEGASYSLAQSYDAELDRKLDGLIAVIAAAQEGDGYLFTNRTIDPAHVLPFSGKERWSSLVQSHELYDSGHLYEAACAHYAATGKRTLLDVALKSAALLLRTFGPDKKRDIPGHQIVEMGLARLYRVTGNREYLELARFFLLERGRHETRPLYEFEDNPRYAQDHIPVLEQREAVGHAVRAVYMYSGMADAAALLGDAAFAEAIEGIWRDVAESKVYLTGGLGARHKGEAFGEAFELPNATAYAETCAAIGGVMWNHRLFLLTGEAKYIDFLEQVIYNRLLAGVSLSGDEYFYVSPLESDGKFLFNHGSAGRQPWFDVSCCPTNLSRFFPSLPGYFYATRGGDLYVNLYASGGAAVEAAGTRFGLTQETDYPWSGTVKITIGLGTPAKARLLLRIPGWARERVLGGGLYRFSAPAKAEPTLRVNGAPAPIRLDRGYAVVEREWRDGDAVELELPMPVRKVRCDPRVEDNRGRAALQRGPLVYCVEERDASFPVADLALGAESNLGAAWDGDLLGGIVVIRGTGFTAIPYYAWANRGVGPMRVWLRDSE